VNNLRTGHEPSDEIELLLLSARDYVRPSEDLRPRVLETARTERQERRMQRNLARMAAVVFLMVMVISAFRQPANAAASQLFSPAMEAVSLEAETSARRHDPSWETVESFTDIRRWQASLLRL
jgi:anti-sigma factor RsiW